jgi:hypothetical protein
MILAAGQQQFQGESIVVQSTRRPQHPAIRRCAFAPQIEAAETGRLSRRSYHNGEQAMNASKVFAGGGNSVLGR